MPSYQWFLLPALLFQAMARLISIFILPHLSRLGFNFSVLPLLLLRLKQPALSKQLSWNLFQPGQVLFKVVRFAFIAMA
jgi:hypothetical protein